MAGEASSNCVHESSGVRRGSSEDDRKFEVLAIDEVAMLEQRRSQGLHHSCVAFLVNVAKRCCHRAQIFGQRNEQRSEGRPVNVERAQTIPDEELVAAAALSGEALIEQVQN